MIEPPSKYIIIITIIIAVFDRGSVDAHFAAIIGISVIARKWPKILDPAISIRTIIEVFNAPLKDFMIMVLLTSLRSKARRKIATVPIVPDSVGLKKPVIIPPMTILKITKMINASGMATNRSFHVAFSPLGAIAGLKLTHPAITAIKRTEIISAGIIPARKSLPMDCSTSSP